ncbi:ABC transporter permease [Mucilaginibacter aquariorum]|uniref:ABC transporter permease n=1 Tax=Mucilaginibacter aquariorum TaxID=2967225 RepID=A0ABT1T439_9SPHI|nr:ABC transporter permease [Mucilaginibacter aquariorum]MCQ6958703.1 ABC transporter permease [Mucilaginibacter aquariorum]
MASKKQTLVAMLGVTFGIAMFILMISFMIGVNQFMERTMLSFTPDIHLYNDISTNYSHSIAGEYFKGQPVTVSVAHPKPRQVRLDLKNAAALLSRLRRDPLVAEISPVVTTLVFYNYGPVQINGSISGVNIDDESRMFDLKDKMVTGLPEALLTADKGILMGSGLAQKLNVQLGDLVSLAAPNGMLMRFRVVGIFRIGISAIDNVRSYVSLANGQQLLGKDKSYITDISIKLHDHARAAVAAKTLHNQFGYKADDWETANASVKTSNLVRDTLTYVVSVTLLIVAGFGIYNIMNMTINNKMKDIAILKAQGFAGRDIMQIFLSQAIFIGILGALSGMLLGFILAYALSSVPFPPNEYVALKYFPVAFEPAHYFFGLLFGSLTPLAAGLMPSLKAAKIDPVMILRG